MQIFKIVLLILLATGLHAKDAKWQKLKSLESYSGNAYTLKEGVEYFEIREYFNHRQSKKDKNIYIVRITTHRTPLKSFDPKIVKRFRDSQPNLSTQTNIRKWIKSYDRSKSNGFMIDDHGKIWRMNTTKDVIEMLGEIDTPAEAKMILWLNDEYRTVSDGNYKDKYRKTSKGYTIISEHIDGFDSEGHCSDLTYRIKITKKGHIAEHKLIKKKPGSCIHGDPPMSDTSGGI